MTIWSKEGHDPIPTAEAEISLMPRPIACWNDTREGSSDKDAMLRVALLALRIWDPGFIEALRQKSSDIYPLMHPHATRQNLVAAVDTDELSLRSLDDAAAAPREG
jgi:hypothetical protein